VWNIIARITHGKKASTDRQQKTMRIKRAKRRTGSLCWRRGRRRCDVKCDRRQDITSHQHLFCLSRSASWSCNL